MLGDHYSYVLFPFVQWGLSLVMESFPHIWSIWLLCFPVLCTLLLHQARYWQLYWRCPILWLLCHYQRPCDGHDWCCWLRVYFDLLAENFCQYQGRLDASASNCIILLPHPFLIYMITWLDDRIRFTQNHNIALIKQEMWVQRRLSYNVDIKWNECISSQYCKDCKREKQQDNKQKIYNEPFHKCGRGLFL